MDNATAIGLYRSTRKYVEEFLGRVVSAEEVEKVLISTTAALTPAKSTAPTAPVIKTMEVAHPTTIGRKFTPTPGARTGKVHSTKHKPRPPRTNIMWSRHQEWLDKLLDGDTHLVSFSYIETKIPEMPIFGWNNFRQRLWKESRKRGNQSVSVSMDKQAGILVVQAIK